MKRLMICFLIAIGIFNTSMGNLIENSADTLVKMKILNGYEDGSLRLENNITRAEFCALILNMIGVDAVNFTENKFSDVKEGAWYCKAVNTVAQMGYINGYKEDGSFRPSNNITYAESCAITINILGYNNELSGEWPSNVTEKAKELGITSGIDEREASYKMTRGEIAVMLVNCMSIKVR